MSAPERIDMLVDIGNELQRLVEAHPQLLRGRAPAASSYLAPGWYPVVDRLCSTITTSIAPDHCLCLEIRLVHQQYDELLFYYRFDETDQLHTDCMSSVEMKHFLVGDSKVSDDEGAFVIRIRDLVDVAFASAPMNCEACGASGRPRDLGDWLINLCDRHLADVRAIHQLAETGP